MKLMIIDGNSIANRGFYGVRPLSAPDGTPTNAIFGFMTIFHRILGEIAPDAVAVTFDEHAKTFRHQAFPTYKAQRKGMPEDLLTQMPILREILEKMNIRIFSLTGYEADDILGTAGRICETKGWECVIVTGDRDSLQLVSDHVSVCLIKTRGGQTETTLYTPALFTEEYGFAPRGIVDLKALMGDSSDNISGVPGIGEKTANDLIRTYGSLGALYTALPDAPIKDGVRKKLLSGEQSAWESYWLATIFREVPITIIPEDCLWKAENFAPGLYDLLVRLGFQKLIAQYHLQPPAAGSGASAAETGIAGAADSKGGIGSSAGSVPGSAGSAASSTASAGNAADAASQLPHSASAKTAAGTPSAVPGATAPSGVIAQALPCIEIDDDSSDTLRAVIAAAAASAGSDAGATSDSDTQTDSASSSAETAAAEEYPVYRSYLAFESEAPDVSFTVCDGEKVYSVARCGCMLSYDELLRALLSNAVPKVTQNLKELQHALLHADLPCDGFIFDTALAEYLISSIDSDYSAPRLSLKYLGQRMEGVQALWNLYLPMRRRLDELGLTRLYETAELPLCGVLAEMELTGFLVDREALRTFGESLTGSIDALQANIWAEAGREFNINSPKQLGEILFDQMGFKGKKTKTGWSTSADELEKLRPYAPIVDDVLNYRMLTKLKSTYADGLIKVIAPDGRIHTSFQNTVTATGRLSSTEPNLQNIPIRKELGAQIRRMFIASPGHTLVDADYSQIELRLMAHIAGDKAMQDAFRSGEDFHRVTASRVFHVPLEEVSGAMRSRAKAVNFGIVYGISAFSLSQDIGVTVYEAKDYMEAYFEQYSGVRKYMYDIVDQAEKDGYVRTLYGRRRDLPELKDSRRVTQEFGKRVALNMPVQGTAADIMKFAMIAAWKALKDSGLDAKLVLQVHDELIAECAEADAEQVQAILIESMEHAAELSVPLLVEAHSAHSWAEAH